MPVLISTEDGSHSCFGLIDLVANMIADATTFERYDQFTNKVFVEQRDGLIDGNDVP